MCLSPDKYVEVRVYERLVSRGVKEERARGVARKVGQKYREKRSEARRRLLNARLSETPDVVD